MRLQDFEAFYAVVVSGRWLAVVVPAAVCNAARILFSDLHKLQSLGIAADFQIKLRSVSKCNYFIYSLWLFHQ